MKTIKIVVVGLTILGFSGLSSPSIAQAKSITPRSLRGTYYNYQGNHMWSKLIVKSHSASIHYPGSKTFKLTRHAKAAAHKLDYRGSLKKGFVLNAKIKVLADSPFPEGGMKLTSRRINGKKHKVIRGYQSGWQFDFVKNMKVTHSYGKNAR